MTGAGSRQCNWHGLGGIGSVQERHHSGQRRAARRRHDAKVQICRKIGPLKERGHARHALLYARGQFETARGDSHRLMQRWTEFSPSEISIEEAAWPDPQVTWSSVLIREWSYLPVSPALEQRREAIRCEKPRIRHTDDRGNLKTVADPALMVIKFAARPCRVWCQEERDGGEHRALPAIACAD